MRDQKYPVTAAIHFLREKNVAFTPHLYNYVERGGTETSARELGVSENIVIKTLIMESDNKQPFVILMHGDKQVSLKELARQMGVKKVAPCSPEIANRHSGYQVGGTSPFGLRRKMPVYMEESIANLEKIFINGGGKGFLVCIDPKEALRVLEPVLVRVATGN